MLLSQKNIAIVFRGISYIDKYVHRSNKKYTVDFRNNFENVKMMLLEPLKAVNNVDTFICTYEHEYLDVLRDYLKPVKEYLFLKKYVNEKTNSYLLRMMINALDLVDYTQYDYVFLTRFDANYKRVFENFHVPEENISFLQEENFIIIPQKRFTEFYDILKQLFVQNKHLSHKTLRSIIPGTENLLYYDFLYNKTINYYPEVFDILSSLPHTYYTQGKSLHIMRNNKYYFYKSTDDAMKFSINIPGEVTCVLLSFDIVAVKGKVTCFDSNKFSQVIPVQKYVGGSIVWTVDAGEYVEFVIENIRIDTDICPRIHLFVFNTDKVTEDLLKLKDRYQNTLTPYVDTCQFIMSGLVLSKPTNILKILTDSENIRNEDFVCFRDMSSLTNLNYKTLRETLESILKDTKIFVPWLGDLSKTSENLYNVASEIIYLKKCSTAFDIITDWRNCTELSKAIADRYSIKYPSYKSMLNGFVYVNKIAIICNQNHNIKVSNYDYDLYFLDDEENSEAATLHDNLFAALAEKLKYENENNFQYDYVLMYPVPYIISTETINTFISQLGNVEAGHQPTTRIGSEAALHRYDLFTNKTFDCFFATNEAANKISQFNKDTLVTHDFHQRTFTNLMELHCNISSITVKISS